jgi:hypothetical protein
MCIDTFPYQGYFGIQCSGYRIRSRVRIAPIITSSVSPGHHAISPKQPESELMRCLILTELDPDILHLIVPRNIEEEGC